MLETTRFHGVLQVFEYCTSWCLNNNYRTCPIVTKRLLSSLGLYSFEFCRRMHRTLNTELYIVRSLLPTMDKTLFDLRVSCNRHQLPARLEFEYLVLEKRICCRRRRHIDLVLPLCLLFGFLLCDHLYIAPWFQRTKVL